MKLYGNTDIGLVRRANEDSFCCEILSEDTAILIVCDGMGGANGGSTASRMAADIMYDVLKGQQYTEMKPETICQVLLDAVESANTAVYRKSLIDTDLSGMGTTVVAAVVVNEKAYIVHVGDSRAYFVSNEAIHQITVDHSMVQELVRSGDLTELQAKTHPQKNIITRAVGVDKQVIADFNEQSICSGQILFLCSDGLSNYVDDDLILKALQTEPLECACDDLISLAKENGGGDNITVAAVKC